jgi:type III restriction enzyme
MTSSLPLVDQDRIAAIAARMDLRDPNAGALTSIAAAVGQYFDLDGKQSPFEAVVDVATGVGKTYALAASIEYFAAEGVRDFAIIAPGRTILEKSVANFTPGHPKSLLAGMDVAPVVITSENFATAAMRTAMDDADQVKLYIFTVQALVKPDTKVGRKTHKFQEGLGEAFYDHLKNLDDLFVFADEHHCYYSPSFSKAVRELDPWVLIGLTATPHKKTTRDEIIYSYPLAMAIADKLVKTPVIVGRKDDRHDAETKLRDGMRLLELKEQVMVTWCADNGRQPINPVMLVVAPNIAEAEEIATASELLDGGKYEGRVLTVHSDAPDEALAHLAELEEPDSPYRIVVSVGMLKEGWDVKNVYVIASLRASVSELLTEQTLGRGMRLPFGQYTDVEILDTLEVLGHERYDQLLKKAGVLNKEFIDYRTREVLKQNASGQTVAVPETTEVNVPIVSQGAGGTPALGGIASVEEHTKAAEEQVANLQVELAPRDGVGSIQLPQVKMSEVKSEFSLSHITDTLPFRSLGESLAANPESELRRITIRAEIVEDADGMRHTEVVTSPAVDKVASPPTLQPADELRAILLEHVLNADVVPARPTERKASEPIMDAFMMGLGDQASELLGAYMDRAAARLISLIGDQAKTHAVKPSVQEVVESTPFAYMRKGRAETTDDRFSPFKKGRGYEGYTKSMYEQDWFDSSTERAFANIVDQADEVARWVRLQTSELPIVWAQGRNYNPDFIVVETDGMHWLAEVKMNKEATSAEVLEKRKGAVKWVNAVNASGTTSDKWGYLLATESDVDDAKGSWPALRKLGKA